MLTGFHLSDVLSSSISYQSILSLKMKQKASRKQISETPPTTANKFRTPGSKKIYDNVCEKIKVVHGCSLLLTQEVLGFFSLLVHFGRESFLCISEDVYE